jgi:hypothetical protein
MRILVLTSSLLVQRPSSLALAWTDRLQLETWQVSPALTTGNRRTAAACGIGHKPVNLLSVFLFSFEEAPLSHPSKTRRDKTEGFPKNQGRPAPTGDTWYQMRSHLQYKGCPVL